MKKTTIVEVAELAGVSIASVSRFLADRTSVKPLPAIRIADAIEKLNYVPNNFARNLKNGNSNIVGFVQPDISQDLFNQCMKAMNRIFYQNDYMLITCDSDHNPEKERELIKSLIRQNVSKLIVISCGQNTSFLSEISKTYPHLIIANRPEPTVVANSFCEDHVHSGYRIAKYMIEKGCKNFYILGGVENSGATTNRIVGFFKAFEEYGIKTPKEYIANNCINFKTSYDATVNALRNLPNIDCILFTNQRSADGVTKAILKNDSSVLTAGFTSKRNLEKSDLKFPCVMEDTTLIAEELCGFVMNQIKKPTKKIQTKHFQPPIIDIDSNYSEDFLVLNS